MIGWCEYGYPRVSHRRNLGGSPWGGAPLPLHAKRAMRNSQKSCFCRLPLSEAKPRPHTFDCSPCCALLGPPRADDNGSAGAADGSSLAAFVLVAVLPKILTPRSQLGPSTRPKPQCTPCGSSLLPPPRLTGLRRHSFTDQQSTDAVACTRSSRSCRSRTACLWS